MTQHLLVLDLTGGYELVGLPRVRSALKLAGVADLASQAVTYHRIQTSLEPDERQDLTGTTLRALNALVDNLPAR